MACAFLSNHFAKHSAHRQIEEVRSLQEDNARLISYMAQGFDDPCRQSLHDELLFRAWKLYDELCSFDYPPISSAPAPYLLEHESSRNQSILVTELQQLLLHPTDDDLLAWLFTQIADSRRLDEAERKALLQTILDEQLPEYVRATLLSAIMLLVTQWFDAQLVEDLYIFTLDDQPLQLQARAWVTLVLVSIHHSHRVALLPRLQELYQLMADSEPELIQTLQISLQQCRLAFNSDDEIHAVVAQAEDEKEPPSQERIQQFFQLITEGVDLTFSSFANLKGLSFFSQEKLHHWFMPFSDQYPMVSEELKNDPNTRNWIMMIMQSTAQCETDKWSAFVSILTTNRKLMGKIGQQLKEHGLILDKSVLSMPNVLRSVLHDLFRFCYLNPLGKGMPVPLFEGELNLILYPWLRTAVSDLQFQHRVADYLYSKHRWTEASNAYIELIKSDESEELLQRLAYCLDMRLNEPEGPIPIPEVRYEGPDQTQILIRCNSLYPGNKWTLRLLADTHDRLRLYESELLVLREALSYHPDDPGFNARMGNVLAHLGRAKEGLSYIFKADVQKEGLLRVHRAFAKAYLELHDPANAERYISKVLSRPNPHYPDWILGAHIALMAGNIQLSADRIIQSGDNGYYLASLEFREKLERWGIDLSTAQLANDLVSVKRGDRKE